MDNYDVNIIIIIRIIIIYMEDSNLMLPDGMSFDYI